MSDEATPYYEDVVDQMTVGHRFLRDTFNIQEADYLSFDALRQAAQCMGRVIRSKARRGPRGRRARQGRWWWGLLGPWRGRFAAS